MSAYQRRLALNRDRLVRAKDGDAVIGVAASQTGESQALNGLGTVYQELGQYDTALDDFQQALQGARDLGDADGVTGSRNNIATLYEAQGSLDQAWNLLQDSLAATNSSGNRFEERAVLDNLGSVASDLGANDQALVFYNQSLALARDLGDRAGEGTSLNNVGATSIETGDFDGALAALTQALAIARETGYRALEQTVLSNLGRLHEAQGQPDAAIASYMDAIGIAEDVRSLARVDELRTSLEGQTARTYQHVVALLHQQGRDGEAFDLAERSRSRSFLDQVGGGHLDPSTHGDPALVKREASLRTEIGNLDLDLRSRRAQPQGHRDPDAEKKAEGQLSADEAAYADTLTALRLSDPDTASLVSVTTLSLAQVQADLDSSTTLVSYFELSDTYLAFVVTSGDLKVVDLPVAPASLTAVVQPLICSFAAGFVCTAGPVPSTEVRAQPPKPVDVRDPQVPPAFTQLFDWLVRPLIGSLKTPNVAIAPYGELNYVPFAGLYDGQHFFGELHTLTNLPSASALPYIRANGKTGQGEPLIMVQAHVEGLSPLANADAEATAVATALGAQPLLGSQATESVFKQRAPGASIIHIASHGELEPTAPLFSRIYLGADATDSGALTVQDVYGLNLANASLVVLSACETDLGVLSKGDDLVGLTRAFIYAGAPAVIASLWDANDASTSELMMAFYGHLTQGMPAPQALQAAQAETRKDFPNPKP